MAAGTPDPKDLQPGEDSQIEQEVVGNIEDQENIGTEFNSPERIHEICNILTNAKLGFTEMSKKAAEVIERYTREATTSEETSERNEYINKRIKLIILNALKKAEDTITAKKEMAKKAFVELKKEKIEEIKNTIDDKDEVERQAQEYTETLVAFKLFKSYKRLLNLLECGMPYLTPKQEKIENIARGKFKEREGKGTFALLKDGIKDNQARKNYRKRRHEVELVDEEEAKSAKEAAEKAAQEKAAKEAAEKAAQEKAAKEAAEKAAQEKAAKEAAEKAAQEKAAKEAKKKKRPEARKEYLKKRARRAGLDAQREAARKPEEVFQTPPEKFGMDKKNLELPGPDRGPKTPEAIRRLKAEYDQVVDEYGDKPKREEIGKGKLFWKNGESFVRKVTAADKTSDYWDKVWPLSETQVQKYKDFLSYLETAKQTEDDIFEAIQAHVSDGIKISKKMREEIHGKAKEVVEHLFNKRGYGEGSKKTMLMYVLGATDKKSARDKIAFLLMNPIVSDVRKGKAIYEVEPGSKRTLAQVLDQPYGEIMDLNTDEVAQRLYERFGEGVADDIEGFQDVLIKVIKTKGGKEIKEAENHKAVDAAKAAEIYKYFLLAKDAHIHEKEMLALLLAKKENPPYVFDLVNDGNGWQVNEETRKEGPEAKQDFERDKGMYYTLKAKSGLKRRAEFIAFIKNIAPIFEAVRTIIKEIELENKAKNPKERKKPDVAEINKRLGDRGIKEKLGEEYLKPFEKIMGMMEYIGPAYKHALYKEKEEGKIPVPNIKEFQGADVKEEEHTKEKAKVKLDVVFVDIETKLDRIAQRLADERLDQELKEKGPQGWKELLNPLKGFGLLSVASKWLYRNAMEGYRDKYVKEYKARLKKDGTFRSELMAMPGKEIKKVDATAPDVKVKVPEAGTVQQLDKELDAIAERFGIAWTDEVMRDTYINKQADEEIEVVAGPEAEVQKELKKLCEAYVAGNIDDAQFKDIVRKRIIPEIKKLNKDKQDHEIIAFLQGVNVPNITADTPPAEIEKMGLLAKLRAHRDGLVRLEMENMRLILGRAKNVDVKTEVKDLSRFDKYTRKGIEWLQKRPFLGRFVSPPTIAIAGYAISNTIASVAMSKAVRFALPVLGVLVAPTAGAAALSIAGGVAAGFLAGYIRQNKEQIRLKAQKERRDALGYRPSDDERAFRGRYESKLEKEGRLYTKVSAKELTDAIEAFTTRPVPGPGNIPQMADYEGLVDVIAKASALNEISELGVKGDKENRLDLISFKKASPEKNDATEAQDVEQQRLKLLRTIAEGKRRLQQMTALQNTVVTGSDYIKSINDAVDRHKTEIIKGVKLSDANFKKFKRRENWKSAGIGALVGGTIASAGWLFPHEWDGTTVAHDLKPGTLPNVGMTGAEFKQALIDLQKTDPRINPADIGKILTPDPATGTVSQTAIDEVKAKYGLQIIPHGTWGQSTEIIDTHLANPGDIAYSKVDFINALNDLNAKGKITITPAEINGLFDSKGHLTAAGKALLDAKGVKIQEIVTTTPGVPGSPNTLSSGWEVVKVHLHGHKKPALDELRFLWNGHPQLQSDGYHFTIKDMFDPTKAHTKLPAGLSMPTDPSDMKIGLQIKEATGYKWTFISPDSNGNVVIPKEFFGDKVGVVPKGGSILPGLKANALAVGFKDGNDYHIMASVKGTNTLSASDIVPPTPVATEQIGFKGDFVREEISQGTWEAKQLVTEKELHRFYGSDVLAGMVAGGRMKHLEYGKDDKKKQEPTTETSPARQESTPGTPPGSPAQQEQQRTDQIPGQTGEQREAGGGSPISQVLAAGSPDVAEVLKLDDIPPLDVEKILISLPHNDPYKIRIKKVNDLHEKLLKNPTDTALQQEFQRITNSPAWKSDFNIRRYAMSVIFEAIESLDNFLRAPNQDPAQIAWRKEFFKDKYVGIEWKKGFNLTEYRNREWARFDTAEREKIEREKIDNEKIAKIITDAANELFNEKDYSTQYLRNALSNKGIRVDRYVVSRKSPNILRFIIGNYCYYFPSVRASAEDVNIFYDGGFPVSGFKKIAVMTLKDSIAFENGEDLSKVALVKGSLISVDPSLENAVEKKERMETGAIIAETWNEHRERANVVEFLKALRIKGLPVGPIGVENGVFQKISIKNYTYFIPIFTIALKDLAPYCTVEQGIDINTANTKEWKLAQIPALKSGSGKTFTPEAVFEGEVVKIVSGEPPEQIQKKMIEEANREIVDAWFKARNSNGYINNLGSKWEDTGKGLRRSAINTNMGTSYLFIPDRHKLTDILYGPGDSVAKRELKKFFEIEGTGQYMTLINVASATNPHANAPDKKGKIRLSTVHDV